LTGCANQAAKAERLAGVSAEEWRKVADLAQQHGVAQLLYHHLKPLYLAQPGEVVEELKQQYRQNALRNMPLHQELYKLLRLLQEKDIPVMALKGAYLTEGVYKNIALRGMGILTCW
jgi:phosphoglycolate phosphatase-like HAD superfamily hydrolase